MKLFLFTINYPYGKDEITFLPQELEQLSKRFEEIFIFPIEPTEKLEIKNSIPNIKTITIFKNYQYQRPAFSLKLCYLLLTIFFSEFISCNKKKRFIKNSAYLFSSFLRNYHRSTFLEKYLNENNMIDYNSVFYTYWFDEWTTVISILKTRIKKIKIISRAHGFDLYHERNKLGLIPFRLFQLKQINKLFPVSKNGVQYLNEKYPHFNKKYSLGYLGVPDYGSNLFDERKKITIVSCSSIIELKRVEIIAKSIAAVKNIELKWIHFGDGILKEEVLSIAKTFPENIEFELKGYIEHNNIMEYYRINSINLFINLSYYEALPVSIMEAISFGIPVIASDVGGVKEIVNEKTGILVDRNVLPQKVSELIEKFAGSSKNSKSFREGVRNYWKENFYSVNNYNKFAEEIISLDTD
jgi:glycosyltransferase involved in cell wall biosynthesis